MGKFKSAASASTTTKTGKQDWKEIPDTLRIVAADAIAQEMQAQLVEIQADEKASPAIKALAIKAIKDELASIKPTKLVLKAGFNADGSKITNSKTGKQAISISISGGGISPPSRLSLKFLQFVASNHATILEWCEDVAPFVAVDDAEGLCE